MTQQLARIDGAFGYAAQNGDAGLPVFCGESFEDHISTWATTVDEITERHWRLGAVAESARLKFGRQGVERFAGEIGCAASTVYQYAQAYRFYGDSERSECIKMTLEWSHYLTAMYGEKQTGEPAAALLAEAEDSGHSTKMMRESVDQKRQVKAMQTEKQTADRVASRLNSYNVLLAAPPFRLNDVKRWGSVDTTYERSMQDEDLQGWLDSAPIQVLPSAVLFLWARPPVLERAIGLMSAWGFDYRTNFAWLRTDRPRYPGDPFIRDKHWNLLIGTTGRNVPAGHGVGSVMQGRPDNEYFTPAEQYKAIEQLYPGCSYCELFAEEKRAKAWAIVTPRGEIIE
jgi:N6-adenosine-specific RNA methylase IME4